MADKTSKTEKVETKVTEETPKPTCGIVMPISAMDSYSEGHWSDIKEILLDVIESAGFTGNLVSDAEETSVIQKTIVQNVYNNDIVICDISGKNPNVMFELGMRLAFDKATIVIKDFDTGFSFDTSPIEHLLYPRDLRFQAIIEFKEKLKSKIIATYKKSKSDPNYSTFLKSFGEFKVAHLESKEVSADEFIIESLKELKNDVRKLSRTDSFESFPLFRKIRTFGDRNLEPVASVFITINEEDSLKKMDVISKTIIQALAPNATIHWKDVTEEGFQILVKIAPPLPRFDVEEMINKLNILGINIINWSFS